MVIKIVVAFKIRVRARNYNASLELRKTKVKSGFALGFIFLSPPFSPIRFFCAIFSNLEPDFGHFSPKKS